MTTPAEGTTRSPPNFYGSWGSSPRFLSDRRPHHNQSLYLQWLVNFLINLRYQRPKFERKTRVLADVWHP